MDRGHEQVGSWAVFAHNDMPSVYDHSMKIALTLTVLATPVAGYTGLWIATAGDRALCLAEPIDQVERDTARAICRWT